jgi:hypothetical protein
VKMPTPGEVVSFIDAWRRERRTGTVILVRRSTNNPWQVAVVRLQNGEEIEVHPHWIESGGAKQREQRDNQASQP